MLLPLIILSQTHTELTISEIMFRPDGSNAEFIELYNTSKITSLDLDGLKIKYHTSSSDVITGHTQGTILGPEQFAVIFENDYNFASGIYNTIIPADAIVLKITDKTFGGGMSNSSDRDVRLIDASDVEIEAYTYSADNSKGLSDEKKNLSKDNNTSNWGNTTNSNGTPGSINTLSPLQDDIKIESFSVNPAKAIEKDFFELATQIKNNGTDSANSFVLKIYKDVNFNSIGDASEKVFTHPISFLEPGQMEDFSDNISELIQGNYQFVAEVVYPLDQNLSNNISVLSFEVLPPKLDFNEIVINEIMYDPLDNNPEWIEIYNRSNRTINVIDWAVKDLTSGSDIPSNFSIGSNEYVVLSENESVRNIFTNVGKVIIVDLPTLNNSGDKISLYQYDDNLIDEVEYSSSWGGSDNISLERIDPDGDSDNPENWGSSLSEEGGTPGKDNSILIKNYDLSITNINLTPEKPFAGDSLTIEISVSNNGKNSVENFSVNIFDDLNQDSSGINEELIYRNNFANLEPKEFLTITASLDDLEKRLYNFLFEIDFEFDENFADNFVVSSIIIAPPPNEFNDIVINEIMYKPSRGEPEWIEIFNRSDEEINLRGWSVLDRSSSFNFPKEDLILPSNGFLVISDDEAINDFYEIPSMIITGNLPSLNNSGDFLAIKDSLDRFIDSLTYQPVWGGDSGASLERIDVDSSSDEENNWRSSSSENNATPGKGNSKPIQYDLVIMNFKVEKEIIFEGEFNSGEITVANLGEIDVTEFQLKIFLMNPIESPNEPLLLIQDTIFENITQNESETIFIPALPEQDGIVKLKAEVDYLNDENLLNNFIEVSFTKIVFNEKRGDLVINEIMYAPLPPEPEWIEFLNRSNDPININGYSLADSKDTSLVADDDFIILPGQYLIIAKEESFFVKYDLDSNILIKSFPSLNNSGDQILLLDPFNRIIDSLFYSSAWGGSNGRSLERIKPELPTADSSNWTTSQSPGGSSPGLKNAIILKSQDIAINSISSFPEKPFKGYDINLIVEIENKGDTNSIFVLKLFEDIDHDLIEDNLITTSTPLELSPGETTSYTFENQIENLDQSKTFFVIAELEDDADLIDNKIRIDVLIGYPVTSLIINEIMYQPQSGEPEWIELYNNSGEQIDIKNWSILDVLTNPVTRNITNDFIFLEPQSYLVIAKDTSVLSYHDQIPSQTIFSNFANLNNNGDGVVIRDAHGNTIDSVFYKSAWENKSGFSIERISFNQSSVDSTNWKVSSDVEQSTPGRKNSGKVIGEKNYELAVNTISFTPTTPKKGDEIKLTTTIENIGDSNAESFQVNFYYQMNESSILFSQESILQLNSGDSISVTSTSPFSIVEKTIIKVEVLYDLDENLNNNFLEAEIEIGFEFAALLITEIMYAPIKNEPEWIELYNNSNLQIDILNWGVCDASSSVANISNQSMYVSPAEFFIVTSDSAAFKNIYNINSKVFEGSMGSLGNSGDAVFIYDPLSNIIDSLRYSPGWGGSNGFSLERIDFENHSQDSTNWSASLSFDRATPGIANIVSSITTYSKNQIIINEIMFDPDADNAEFIELYNNTDDFIELGGFGMFDDKNYNEQVSPYLYSLAPNEYFIIASDSSFFAQYPLVDEGKVNIVNGSNLGLSNDEDIISIKDFFGNTIDSLNYKTDWHNPNILNTKNRSLERLNPDLLTNDASNWSTSVKPAGATPGEQNSIFVEQLISESNISISPNPFSPDNDGFEDFTSINYSLSKPIAQVRIKIFDSKGRLVRTLSNNQSIGSNGSIIFDGLNDNGNPLKLGIYIVYMEVVDAQNGSTESFKEAIVVARKL